MKEYRIKLHSCAGCPNLRKLQDRDMSIDWCREKSKQLSYNHIYDVPDWCSLPDSVEKE